MDIINYTKQLYHNILYPNKNQVNSLDGTLCENNGLLYINTFINNIKLNAFIDTGCKYSKIFSQTVEKCNLQNININNNILYVDITIFNKKYYNAFNVLEKSLQSVVSPLINSQNECPQLLETNNGVNCDIVIGIDFLYLHKISIDFENNIIFSSDFCEIISLHNIQKNIEPSTYLYYDKNELTELFDNKISRFISLNYIIIDIVINKKNIKALIDTGSNECYISNTCINKCNLSKMVDYNINNDVYIDANGVSKIIGRIWYINIGIGIYYIPCCLNISNDSQFDIILGNDFLIKNNVFIDFTNRQLKLRNNIIITF